MTTELKKLRRVRWAALLAILPACLAAMHFCASTANDYLRPALQGNRGFIEDYQYYDEALVRFAQDPARLYEPISPQQASPFIYPPPSLLLFAPLHRLFSVPVGYVILALTEVCVCGIAIFLALRWSGFSRLETIAAWIVAMATSPVFFDAACGQVNSLVTLLCVSAALLAMKGKTFPAALLV